MPLLFANPQRQADIVTKNHNKLFIIIMDLILSLQFVREDTLPIGIGIVAPLTDDHNVLLWVSAIGFGKSVIYWGVKLFMALYVKKALLYFNRFTIGSQLNSSNISADGVLISASIIICAARLEFRYSVKI